MIKKGFLTAICALMIGFCGHVYADDAEIILDGSTSSSGFSVINSGSVTVMRAGGDTNVSVTGTITADSFVGDGSGLTGVVGGSGDGYSLDASDGTPENAVSVDADGNVGIGETAPLSALHVKNTDTSAAPHSKADELVLENITDAGLTLLSDNAGAGHIYFGDVGSSSVGRITYTHASTDAMEFFTNGSERMRIDSNGNIRIGNPGYSFALAVKGGVNGSGASGAFYAEDYSDVAGSFQRNGTNGDVVHLRKGSTVVGSISVADSSTTYNTTSDQRLKTNIIDLTEALDTVNKLQPRRFDWKVNNQSDIGLIAQEVLAVYPQAVSVPEDPKEMMMVDYSKFSTILIGAVKELLSENDSLRKTLNAENSALKAENRAIKATLTTFASELAVIKANQQQIDKKSVKIAKISN